MRKKKFSKERFYRRLAAQNKNKGCAHVRFDKAHPQGDYSVIIDPELWRDALERAGQALGQWSDQVNNAFKSVAEYLITDKGKTVSLKVLAKTKEKPEQVNDWEVMQSGYPDCQIYPDFRSNMEVDLIRNPLYSKRRGRGGFTGALNVDDHLMPDGGRYVSKETAEKLRADRLFFNDQNLLEQDQPKVSTSNRVFIHLACLTACVVLIYSILK